ncbi:MAG: glycosyltransferase family 39 protein [Firmicutes bacterium]|nr:glycosyltransferase family 39 protein [Bacillota bacterium]
MGFAVVSWVKIFAKRTIVLLALIWALWIYYLFFKSLSYPRLPTAIFLGFSLVFFLAIYGLFWYLVRGRHGYPTMDLGDFPLLLFAAFTAIIADSFVVAATVGDFHSYLSNNLQEVTFLLTLIAAVFYLGELVTKRLRTDNSVVERIFISVVAGLGVMAILILVAGVIGFLHPLPIRIVVLLLATLGAIQLTRLRKQRSVDREDLDFLPNPISLSLTVILAFGFVVSWAPLWNYDSLLYHIGIPKLYLQTHGIYYIRDFLPANYPLNGEMLFMLSLALKDDILTQLLSYFISLWLILGVFLITKRLYSDRAAAISIVLMLTLSAFVHKIPVSDNDALLSLFILACLFAFAVWREKKQNGWLYLSALMLGFAAGTKYSGFLVLVTFGLPALIIIATVKGKETSDKAQVGKVLAIYLALTLVGFGPWLFKNYLFTGNPTCSMLMGIFEDRDCIASLTNLFQNTVKNPNLLSNGNGPLGYSFIPRFLLIGEPSDLSMGPALLSFLPLALRKDILAKPMSIILVVVAAGFLIPWLVLPVQVTQFALPGLVLIMPLISAGIDSLTSNNRIIKVAIVLLLLAGVFTNIFLLTVSQIKAFSAGMAYSSHQQFMRNNALYQAYNYINKHIPSDEKIAMVIGDGIYYLNKRPLLILNPLNNSKLKQAGFGSPERLMWLLRREGIDYVLISSEVKRYVYNQKENASYSIYRPLVEDLDLLILSEQLDMVYKYQDIYLYKIAEIPATRTPTKSQNNN